MSEWLKEHAWKLILLAHADAHEIAPTHFRSTTSPNNDLLQHVPVSDGVAPGFRGVCDTVLTQCRWSVALTNTDAYERVSSHNAQPETRARTVRSRQPSSRVPRQEDQPEDRTSSIPEAISQADGGLAGHVVMRASKGVAFIEQKAMVRNVERRRHERPLSAERLSALQIEHAVRGLVFGSVAFEEPRTELDRR